MSMFLFFQKNLTHRHTHRQNDYRTLLPELRGEGNNMYGNNYGGNNTYAHKN